MSTGPNRFAVTLGDGQVRYACCAIDTLGLAPMLGALTVRGVCHGSGLPLVFGVAPEGPAPEAAGVMVWVSPRPDADARACATL